ncbi:MULTISPECIES: hypothetical protein [unclassified Saccharopolyspora]|uniref:hypothetical protein n=1 Tax=unclassified Saccharopolyspora TaxID=2646250 RepID=UPI001CD46564|nr:MULTISPECIES: hypothetical protein [unclassified Saccharopolyspora]MCA1186013.1 hypothetical protein [Saccharopolyspora sp. 6T]MCA1192393.1 hypothetical protein [Saccharopolyspora sp. 6V]MCA1227982.1 hypothetical protein [Saccharopolyspora sp. 6M]MCA1280050.1 hypothetical protein [Saccharopolyspora sp. 7B]
MSDLLPVAVNAALRRRPARIRKGASTLVMMTVRDGERVDRHLRFGPNTFHVRRIPIPDPVNGALAPFGAC